jgi:hypothetical protein
MVWRGGWKGREEWCWDARAIARLSGWFLLDFCLGWGGVWVSFVAGRRYWRSQS